MDLLDKIDPGKNLELLLAEAASPCVSVYLSSHRTAVENQRDPIRFKNLLRQAEDRLVQRGMRRPDLQQLLEPAHRLLQNTGFWQQLGEGLAFFAWRGGARVYQLPLANGYEETVHVGTRPHVARVLLQLDGIGHFFVLALSQKGGARLYRGGRHALDPVEVPDMPPPSIAEALLLDETEQIHASARSPAIRGDRGPNMHAHGSVDEPKKHIEQYFRMVDGALHAVLRGERAPLVLAGVEYLMPLYRAASGYPHIVQAGVRGNPDAFDLDELRQKAWPLVEPELTRARREALAQFRELHSTGTKRASIDLREIVAAAHYGRVEALFIAPGSQSWGSFDAATGEVTIEPEPDPHADDLYDSAARETYLHGGTVFPLASGQLDTPLAAIFRF